MLRVALSQFQSHSRRFIAVGLAVMLSVAFLSTTLMVGASTRASLGASLGEAYSKAGLVALPDTGTFDDAALAAVRAVPGVTEAYGRLQAYAEFTAGGQEVSAQARNLAPAALETAAVTDGVLPERADGVAVDGATAARYGLQVGDPLLLRGPDGAVTVAMTVTGILRGSNDPFASALPQVLAGTPAVSALAAGTPGPGAATGDAAGYGSIQLALAPGADAAEAGRNVLAALAVAGTGAQVKTADEQVTAQVAMMTGGQDELTIILLAFAGVALLVSGLVVSNTFAVLVAQRTRELALLRCLGAGRSQVRSSVLAEALVVGLVSSAAGVLAAVGLMAALIGWAGMQPDMAFATMAVPPSSVIAGLAVGTLLTVGAALVPAKAATAVAPLAALRPADDAGIGNRRGRVRLVLGLGALALGVPLLAFGAAAVMLVVAFAGGVLSFVGVLLCATLFVPRLVGLAGRLAAPAGVPGKLAALNAVRNPARTSVTAAALLIGVTLVSLMMTGAATARQAFDNALAGTYPVDMALTGDALTDAGRDAAARVDGVAAAALLPAAGTMRDGDMEGPVYALDAAEAGQLLRDTTITLEPGRIYLPEGSPAGSVEVNGTAGTVTLEAVVLRTRNIPALVSTDTARRFGPLRGVSSADTAGIDVTGPAASAIWLRLADAPANGPLSADRIRDIQSAVAGAAGVSVGAVSGAAIERVTFNEVIDVLLLVVTGLLGVAVLIALIGVANTLSLSVLERTRENSLLRALGLTKGQLRGMLALEAALVAGVAALLGAALGTLYGWLGARSALGSLAEVTPSIPWLQLLGVLAVAVVAGLLASVIPARRAARLSPVQGLAAA
ncbi:ABC transporter permease [Pseudarthrobacter sp. NIBRBAC000502770]|uniref:ABC transporter permease n=1 Tax=Pseudarthrobacter sp. NIBRBAC000502770 TaxID=2590785 RepID=UPI00113FF493|nr:ABC transporter permease [Pseudarthrobacter sp. NIBRBAC000502770]QDG88717.1 ABC transporter permease [Pseudarthrobacter sp. NIBRBAC000502770]